MKAEPLTAWDEPAGDDGCAYIVENGHIASCGEPTLPGSSYCLVHHEVCYLPRGSRAETRKISSMNYLGLALWAPRAAPTDEELDRIERAGTR